MLNEEQILLFKDEEFMNFISDNEQFLTRPNIALHLLKIEPSKGALLLGNINVEYLKELLKQEELVLNMGDQSFKTFFLTSDDAIKKIMIQNVDYFEKILKLKPNINKKNVFDLVNNNIKADILNNKDIIDQIDKKLYTDLLNRLSTLKVKEFHEVILELDPVNFIKNEEDLKSYLNSVYKLNEQDAGVQKFILDKFINNPKLQYYLLKIENIEQLQIFEKFDLFVDLIVEKNEVRLSNDKVLPFEYIKKVNKKHISLLINQLLKDNEHENNENILLTAIKLYSVFGYDNSKKILDNKFTYMTEAAIKRTAEIIYVDNRRQYRLENQNLFYSHLMIKDVANAADNGDREYFQNLLRLDTQEVDELIAKIQTNRKLETAFELTTGYIQDAIQKREKIYKEKFMKEFKIAFTKQYPNKRNPITCLELCRHFGNVNLDINKLESNGKIEGDKLLSQFLIGNEKNNNDSILRLVLNKSAYGLNETLSIVINEFPIIKSIVDKSDGKLSLFNLLDVIEICKVCLYNMPPNEQDLTLESIAKISRVDKYCEEPSSSIFKRARELHLKRKTKIYSSIPIVAKKETNGIICKTYKYDDPALVTIGIDTDSCLKVGGKGEDMLRYCMLEPNGLIVNMRDEANNLYICPFIRNGNGIYGNGIDPVPPNLETSDRLMKALIEYTNEFMRKSRENEKIEFVAITNLHQSEYFDSKDYKILKIKDNVFVNSDCYSDITKDDVENYILTAANDEVKPVLYEPSEKYYEIRRPSYVYHDGREFDKDAINMTINSICYSAIDFKLVDDKEKNSLKRGYEKLNVEQFEYVVGNKDWFVAVDRNMNITGRLLPYDQRAKTEYREAIRLMQDEYNLYEGGQRKL